MELNTEPYWLEQAHSKPVINQSLPTETDVLIIGSGYTGLQAALQTARAGRSTCVIDAEQLGRGCSTRNGGQISTSIKPDWQQLTSKYGKQQAANILSEGHESLLYIEEFIKREQLDCDFQVCGRFHAAHNSSAFKKLCSSVQNQAPGFEVEADIIPVAEQYREIGSDAYHGGIVYHKHASLHPARYHAGLLKLVEQAGVSLVPFCRALHIQSDNNTYVVKTSQGSIKARNIVIATNGYTGDLVPWLQRRVIPIGSYMMATEEIPSVLLDRLMPSNRVVSDTRNVVYYYRKSVDGKRILFGGRVAAGEILEDKSGPLLKQALDGIFPELKNTAITHSWSGTVAYGFDTLAHTGRYKGLYYAMGYCGSGVGMSSYLGMRIGQQVLGLPEGRTAFDQHSYPTRPLYYGKPWFLAPSVHYYRLRDKINL